MPARPIDNRAHRIAAYERATPDLWPVCPRCGEIYPGRQWRLRCVCGCKLYPPPLDEPRKRA